MEDVFAPLRRFIDPDMQKIERLKLHGDQFLGRIGAVEFCVLPEFDDGIAILLRKPGGQVTTGNIKAFWRHWGYDPPNLYKMGNSVAGSHVQITIHKDEVERMIKAKPKGTDRGPVAEVKCDCCGFTENVRADYERLSADKYKLNEGQVLVKATKKGWSSIKGTLRCPECETKRREEAKPQKEITMKNVVNLPVTEEPRQPSREQKRQIVTLLTEVYDINSNRYTGGETDKTVADAIGNGVLFGWVSQIREDLFGPDGSNEELMQLEADVRSHEGTIKDLTRDMAACSKLIADGQTALAAIRANQSDLQRRIDALKASVGPRARNV